MSLHSLPISYQVTVSCKLWTRITRETEKEILMDGDNE